MSNALMPQISTRSLIQLCHRVGTAVRSGIDARRMWEMEERHATGRLRPAISAIRQQVASGGTVAEGMQASNGYFPPMFVQMVAVGEQTGKLDEVLHRLAEHFEHLANMRRTFLIGIAWPLFELVFAVLVIGFVIFITGIIGAAAGGAAPDVLGWGLVGTSGAIMWFLFCGFIAGGIALASHALIHAGDGEFFRSALSHAATACDLPLLGLRERGLTEQVASELGIGEEDLPRRLAELGRSLGAPWTVDQKLASLAAWTLLHRSAHSEAPDS